MPDSVHWLDPRVGFVLNDARWLYAMLYESQNPKTIENRHVKLAAGWYAVSLSQAAHTSIADDIAFKKEFPHFKGALAYTKGVVHGAVRIDRSLPQAQCAESRWSLADYKIANIVSHTLLFDPRDSVPVRGMYPSSRSHTRARPLLKRRCTERACARPTQAIWVRLHWTSVRGGSCGPRPYEQRTPGN